MLQWKRGFTRKAIQSWHCSVGRDTACQQTANVSVCPTVLLAAPSSSSLPHFKEKDRNISLDELEELPQGPTFP